MAEQLILLVFGGIFREVKVKSITIIFLYHYV